ncbi:MAG: carbamoyl-phosphate synthase large subunit [Alphaproteobacteria bacterium]
MPKREDIKSILIIGAGPIIIGQACEFDYSGTQACKALKKEGYRIILVNSNPATIMTDPEVADATYIEPITSEIIEKIILKEKPDALLPTMGGQTALNVSLEIASSGFLEKNNVELIGANKEAISKAENREEFREAMNSIGLETPKSFIAHTLEEANRKIDNIGLPAIIRPSFTLGGTGGGIAYDVEEFNQIVGDGLKNSPNSEVLVEESVIGWKEFEMEVVRDKSDNCIIICSIENIDPMGVHTGDSITVAPALTLTDREYQELRNASIKTLREIGVDTGGSNVQFAVNPNDGRIVIIEMNPRVSRSSALASKATGFPIAKVAALLAVGYSLDELVNDITTTTPASFEPSIDYVVTKIPRFAFEKFPGSESTLTTSMKSVGEAMSIGGNFQESIQKGLRSLENDLEGFNQLSEKGFTKEEIKKNLKIPCPERLLYIAEAFRSGLTVEEINLITFYDPWFLKQIEEIILWENLIQKDGLPEDKENFKLIKSMGFSDSRLAKLINEEEAFVRNERIKLNLRPVYKKVDTCAAEFETKTDYMYSTYVGDIYNENEYCESFPTKNKKVIILGGGPNRIGQGIEFDYCCCHAAFALADLNIESIMINCNPETVSTDYDTSDRLYFEPLTLEDVSEIINIESKKGDLLGAIVQFGGQTPLKLSKDFEVNNIPIKILGTDQDAIDLAEDRDRFKNLMEDLQIKQPNNGIAKSADEAINIANEVGYPVVIRPSYVLGGRAMEIVHSEDQLKKYINEAVIVSGSSPVLIDSYLRDAIEVDIDTLSDGKDFYIAGILEHIEEAGVHSGDSACSMPPFSLNEEIIAELKINVIKIAKAMNVKGLMNVQFAIKDDDIFILEVNPRASRTVPFVAKVSGNPIAKIATKIMTGVQLKDVKYEDKKLDHIAIKEAVFPFKRFPGVDTILGPEMRSTGEVMGIDKEFGIAFAKSQIAGGTTVPIEGVVFVSVKDTDKEKIYKPVKELEDIGFSILATSGTCDFLEEKGIKTKRINKVLQGSPHIVDEITDNNIALVFNTTETPQAIKDSKSIRRSSLENSVPYYTTVSGAIAAVSGIKAIKNGELDVDTIQSYKK